VDSAATQLQGTWDAVVQLTLKGRAVAWTANSLTAEAQLPILHVSSLQGVRPHLQHLPVKGNPEVTVLYKLPDAPSYDWAGGPAPNAVFAATGAEWIQPLSAMTTPIAVSGTNNAASKSDSFRTFVAGILLGVAGAALIASLGKATLRIPGAGRSSVSVGRGGRP
jgi:hypothetical protein